MEGESCEIDRCCECTLSAFGSVFFYIFACIPLYLHLVRDKHFFFTNDIIDHTLLS